MQAAAEKFIAVGVEVGALSTDKGEAGKLFQQIAKQGHYGKSPAAMTLQGTYLATPVGKLLASGNEQNPNATLDLLTKATSAWNRLTQEERLPKTAPTPDAQSKSKFPNGGLALDVSLRKFFPRPLKNTPPAEAVLEKSGLPPRLRLYARTKPETYWDVEWNQDHAWFTSAEARKLLPHKLVKGERGQADLALIERLARLHILDTVRALADVYPADSVKDATLNAEVVGVKDGIAEVTFEGRVRLQQTGLRPFSRSADQTAPIPRRPERGYDARLLGKASFDSQRGQFIRFELVALGTKMGGSTLSAFSETTMGVTFTLAPPGASDPIEPRYLNQYGW